jgi:hypothetical protein
VPTDRHNAAVEIDVLVAHSYLLVTLPQQFPVQAIHPVHAGRAHPSSVRVVAIRLRAQRRAQPVAVVQHEQVAVLVVHVAACVVPQPDHAPAYAAPNLKILGPHGRICVRTRLCTSTQVNA